jgi:CBS domain-containing protein
MKIRDVLKVKGTQVYSVAPHRTVKEALALLVQFRVGALLVLDDDGHPLGIISERDVLRECHRDAGRLAEMLVRDAMTRDLLVGLPDDDLPHIMGIMTHHRVRHLPVLDGARVAGLISIGDVVKACLEQTEGENHYLREYIQAR